MFVPEEATITGIAFLLLASPTAATPCEDLTRLALSDATIASAVVVPKVPLLRAERAEAAHVAGRAEAVPRKRRRQRHNARCSPPREAARLAANIPAHCRVQMTLKPTADSLINMELWLPTEDWNGKFMGVGNGGFAGYKTVSWLRAFVAFRSGTESASTHHY